VYNVSCAAAMMKCERMKKVETKKKVYIRKKE